MLISDDDDNNNNNNKCLCSLLLGRTKHFNFTQKEIPLKETNMCQRLT